MITEKKKAFSYAVCFYCYIALMILIALAVLTSCKSVSSVETSNENHRVSELVDRMDSLFKKTSSWQQDIYQKQSSLVDSFKQKERNDSSHSVVVNERGDTVKERIVIYKYIEREHNSEKSDEEIYIHKLKEVDSLLRVSLEKQAVTDSLLREHDKEVTKEKSLTLWQKIKINFGGYAIFITLFILFVIVFTFIRWLQRKSILKG